MEEKQGSIDWLVEEINKQKAWADPSKLEPIIQRAKATHKEEIETAWYDGISGGECGSREQYYNETFGGNNE